MMRSSRSVLLSPPARWTTRRCWSGCGRTVSDPVLTQNPKKADRHGRKQRKIRRANGGKKHKLEPKQLRFCFETTYGPEGRGFESLTAYQKSSKSSDFEDFCFLVTKEKRRRNALRCATWGTLNPITRKIPNPKANNRKKARKRMASPYSVSFCIKMPRSLTGAFCISQW